MKFLILVKATAESEAGKLPDEKLLNDMMKYNEELQKAGVLLDLAGLQPSSKGARVRFSRDGKRTVTDGPFTETKELVAGFWIIDVKSKAEAIEWVKRVPFHPQIEDSEIEIRPLFEGMDAFPDADDETRARAAEIDKSLRK